MTHAWRCSSNTRRRSSARRRCIPAARAAPRAALLPASLPALASGRRAWSTTNFFEFQADFHNGAEHLLLNHTYVPAADLVPGYNPPRPFRARLARTRPRLRLGGG